MGFSEFIARQSGKPEGLFGRMLMGFYLDRVNEAGNQLVYDTFQVQPDSRVLEVGFGGGELLFRIANQLVSGSIDGIELSQVMLDHAMNRALKLDLESKINFHLGKIEKLPYQDGSFDRVCSVNTVYFWPDLDTGLAELARVMKANAVLVLGFGCDQALRKAGYEEKGFKLYTSDQIASAYRHHGLVPEKLESIERPGRGPFYAYRAVKLK
jgi:arsenite methyltransferase